jgi:hypothetical protein
MNISLAIDDLVSTVNSLAGVVPENQEPGNVDFHLTVTLGEQSNEYHFGATKNIQQVVLRLSALGIITNNETAAKCKSISDAIVADRRRGGNAQTTVIGPWTKEEDEGREGVVFESIVEIHAY